MRTATRLPLERIAALDHAIRAGKHPNAASLARELEVCRRTVQRDIEFLRDRLRVPLVYDPERNGYAYSDPDYRLPLLTLTRGSWWLCFSPSRYSSSIGAHPTLQSGPCLQEDHRGVDRPSHDRSGSSRTDAFVPHDRDDTARTRACSANWTPRSRKSPSLGPPVLVGLA